MRNSKIRSSPNYQKHKMHSCNWWFVSGSGSKKHKTEILTKPWLSMHFFFLILCWDEHIRSSNILRNMIVMASLDFSFRKSEPLFFVSCPNLILVFEILKGKKRTIRINTSLKSLCIIYIFSLIFMPTELGNWTMVNKFFEYQKYMFKLFYLYMLIYDSLVQCWFRFF